MAIRVPVDIATGINKLSFVNSLDTIAKIPKKYKVILFFYMT